MRLMTIKKDSRTILMNMEHALYYHDINNNFDHYFNAVESDGVTVDYSKPAWHKVRGYDWHEILFPSLPEPVEETQKYLDFANLQEGETVLDLGAYSGLSAMLFKEEVHNEGTIIAVEADGQNFEAMKQNIEIYQRLFDAEIKMLFGAIWNHGEGIQFSSEQIMGSAQANIVGYARGKIIRVPSYTLSGLANKFQLEKIDFIKVDIEGAESVIFEDTKFFQNYHPRMIVEVHSVPANGPSSADKVKADLGKVGYQTRQVGQLIQCW